MKVVTINGTFAHDYGVSVHSATCADVPKAIRQRDHFVEEFDTKRALWLDYNHDFLEEEGEDGAWPIHFYPCTKGLPEGGHYTVE